MSHTLPDLEYSTDALEPHFDGRTMEIHHGKHHQTYINNLNAALEGNESLASLDVDSLVKDLSAVPEELRKAVRNNGGGHSNHTFFLEMPFLLKAVAFRREAWLTPSLPPSAVLTP